MSIHRLKTSLAVSLACWLGCNSLKAAEDYQQVAEESVKSYLAEHPYAAVTVGIVDAEGTHIFGFGQLRADDPNSQPDGKTIYQIGSITKVFTTTMLAEQVELGHVKLADPAQKYLPPDLVLPQEKDREITLEDLATHHSGLPRLPQLVLLFIIGSGGSDDPYALLSWDRIAQMLPDVWLSSAIGAKYNYSNLGMGLLGQALVTATNSDSYAALLEKRITTPLGMVDTCLKLSDEQRTRLAPAQLAGGKKTVPWHFASLEGCGALYSTVDNLLIFAAANLELKETPLSAAFQLAQQPRPGRSRGGGTMGLGWHRSEYHEIPLVWHNGGTGGYRSMMALLPTKKMGIVMLSNTSAAIDPYTYHFIDLLFPSKNKQPQPTTPAE